MQKVEEEITHGDRQDQEIATRDSRLRAATLGSWPSLLVTASREAERCVIASSTHPTGYRLTSLRDLRDLCGLIPPVLSPWSISTGELTPWPPQHRSKPTAAMRRGAPGRKPTGGRPAYGATPSNTA